MQERIASFGPEKQLVGIMTLPAAIIEPTVACVLLNAGVIHRIGPHRVNVKIARTLATLGVPSLRLDLSGLGDSKAARGSAPFWDQARADVQSAMDFLQRDHGISRFLIVGICSGAVNGYHVALADSRVEGLLMFDGFTYPTSKTVLIRKWTRFRRMSWSAVARKAWSKLRESLAPAPDAETDAESSVNPAKGEFRASMDALSARGVSLFLIYSNFSEAHNYHNQLYDAFRGAQFLHTIRYDFRPDIDHTITSLKAQREFIDHVTSWVSELTGRNELSSGRAAVR